jgi:hypothetical protein
MELKADSTFVFNWQIGNLSGTTEGTWVFDRETIKLNSEIQPKIQPKKENDRFIVEEINDSTSQKTVIHVKDENGEPLPYAECAVVSNGKYLSDTTDFNGNVSFDISKVTFIHIIFGFEHVQYKNKNKSHNNFVFILKQVNKTYLYFTNERLQENEGRLSDFTKAKDKWVNNYYEKIER